MTLFRLFLGVLWLLILFVTIRAMGGEGWAGTDHFVADMMAHSWRAQFNTDFSAHLLLMGLWVAWRNKFSVAGFVLAFFCAMGGGLVSLIYLLVLSFIHKGDAKAVLLGRRADQPA